MPAREVAHLRFPIGVVGRIFVQENDGRSASRLLEIEADLVVRDGVGHSRFPSLLFVLARFLARTGSLLKMVYGRKSQLILAAAMRQNRLFCAMK
jgi:hypothetical protein